MPDRSAPTSLRAQVPAGPAMPALLTFAAASAVAVGNVYFPQTVAPQLADRLEGPPTAAAALIGGVQVGYAIGNYVIVPLGDAFAPRTLLSCLTVACALGLLAVGLASDIRMAVAASAVIGMTTVTAFVLGPTASRLTPAARQGRVNSLLLAGCIGGMLVARTAAGVVTDVWGWRVAYLAAAGLTVLAGAAAAGLVPAAPPTVRVSFGRLLLDPVRLLRSRRELQRSCLYQGAVFAGFTAIWSTVAVLITGPTYGGTATQVGLLALVNIGTMLAVPLAGRAADRYGSDAVNRISLAIIAAGALILPIGAMGGTPGWAALIGGTLLLDVGMQTGMVANQVRVYAIDRAATSRLNTAYMTTAYLCGSLGSIVPGAVYGRFGWAGPCAELAVVVAVAVVLLTVHTREAAADE